MQQEARLIEFKLKGVAARSFRGEADYPNIVAINNAAWAADDDQSVDTVEQATSFFRNLERFDPARDMIVVEGDGAPVAYIHTWWWDNDEGERLFALSGQVHPHWRRKGIGSALLRWQEARIAEIAAEQGPHAKRFIQGGAEDRVIGRVKLFEHAGYVPVRFGNMMVRDLSGSIPDLPLPAGLELRPVRNEDLRTVWEAANEAFRDHWGHRESTDVDWQRFLEWPDKQPENWQIAWDIDRNEIAGGVHANVFPKENEKFNMLRGWTDPVYVRRPWRKRGLAKALLVRAMRKLVDLGMNEAALGVDTENPNGALGLYESLGFRPVKRWITYRKSV